MPLIMRMALCSCALTVGKHLLGYGMWWVYQKIVHIRIQLLMLSLYHSLLFVMLDKALLYGLFLRDMFQWIVMIGWRFWWVKIFPLSNVKVIAR